MTEDEREVESIVAPPYLGARVFYFAYGTPGGEYPAAVPRVALVTEVDTFLPHRPISLAVFNPTGLFFNRDVLYHPGKPGCWGWLVDGSR